MSISAPTRDLGQETRDTLQTQVDLAPDVYAAEAEYSPKYTDLAVSNYSRALKGSDGADGLLRLYENEIAPSASRANAAASSSARGADVQDLEQYGARAVSAIKASDPQLQKLMDMLAGQATEELAMGATLDPSLRRETAQSVRSAQAARGFGFGGNDVAEEGLFTALRAEQLRQSRRAFAQSVASQRQAGAVDPAMAILGRASMANPALLNQGAAGAQGAAAGVNFDPMQNAYAQDYWNTNYNARSAAKIAGNNANAALWGSAIESVGNLAGGAMCWVAREVFGAENPQWRVFRQWMLAEAPETLRALYLRAGAGVAEFIRDQPALKARIRAWMETKIEGREYV